MLAYLEDGRLDPARVVSSIAPPPSPARPQGFYKDAPVYGGSPSGSAGSVGSTRTKLLPVPSNRSPAFTEIATKQRATMLNNHKIQMDRINAMEQENHRQAVDSNKK